MFSFSKFLSDSITCAVCLDDSSVIELRVDCCSRTKELFSGIISDVIFGLKIGECVLKSFPTIYKNILKYVNICIYRFIINI